MKLFTRTSGMARFLFLIPLVVAFTMLASNRVSAAPHGCYTRSAGSGEFQESTCPNSDIQAQADAGKCFVSQVVPKQAPNYQEYECANITLGSSGGSTAQTPNEFVVTPANDCGDCISKDIEMVINLVAIGVAVVVVAMIIIGGLQYMLSRDNPQAVQAAKSKILNAIIALVAFIFVYAFLQWVVPGGVF